MVKIPRIHSTKHGFLILLFSFIITRIFYYLIGIRFDITPLYWFFQFIDPQLLQTELLKSILYLHTQPPGFNLFLGSIIKLANNNEALAFALTYQAIGLIMILSLYLVLRKLAIPLRIALPLTMFFAISPPVILLENWLFYTYPVTCLLVLSVIFLNYYLDEHIYTYLFLFFSTLSLIVLTRSLFHPIWFIIILIGVIAYNRDNAKRIILCALFPMLVIGSVYVKNYVFFKQVGLSSWFGMNLAKMTLTVPWDKIKPLVEKGELSGIATIMPFQTPETYQEYANFDTLTGIRVLDRKYKSNGFVNLNHIAYIQVSQQYFIAAKYLIKKYPHYYGLSVVKACYAFLRPCSDSMIIRNKNRRVIGTWVNIYENYLVGDILSRVWNTHYTNRYDKERKVHLNFLYFLVPVLCIWGLITIAKGAILFKYRRVELITITYAMFNIIYVTIAGNLLEVSENMRFRFLILPLLYIFLAIWFKYLFNRTKRT